MRRLFITLFFFVPILMTAQDPARYVNPFIGTQRMGHTFPGACVPFGAVQLSPDTDTVPHNIDGKYQSRAYEYCSGYQYDDKTIVGFSHTHLNGTGHSDLGDILLMPVTGELKLNPGTADNPDSGYRSRFSHQREEASPGYYKVFLDDYNVEVRLTATERGGMHRYTYTTPEGGVPAGGRVIVDLNHGIYNYQGKVLWSQIRVEDEYTLTGYRITQGWARTNYTYFAIKFSRPVKNYGCRINNEKTYNGFWRKFNQKENFPEMGGQGLTAYFEFDLVKGDRAYADDGVLEVQVALSAVDALGALNNLRTEMGGKSFESVLWQAQEKWNKELSVVTIESASGNKVLEDRRTSFYTALYHTMINPSVYQDVDGRYRGIDHNIHYSEDHVNYTVFSVWDTFRALHPLMNLIKPERSRQFVASMLAHYDQSVHKMLPVWSLQGNENWCMIGYHSVSVLADAYVKGLLPQSLLPRLLDAMARTASNPNYEGMAGYKKYGFVPAGSSGSSASVTLEYAYDDWCIFTLADRAADVPKLQEFRERAVSYQWLFHPETGFVRPRKENLEWITPFDELDTHGQGFIEGNSWNYSFYVPHNVEDLIRKTGGDKRFEQRLDSLFTMNLPDSYFEKTEDITRDGIIGNYVHGNEPSHHVPYLYAWNSPWKGQKQLKQIMDTMYRNAPDGLCGNDDCGQMSAWYIFTALGFYPVCPGTDEYVLGVPYFKKISVRLENGNTFTVNAPQLTDSHIYVKEVRLNGTLLNKAYITHRQIMDGGELTFIMTDRPVKNRTFRKDQLPYSFIKK